MVDDDAEVEAQVRCAVSDALHGTGYLPDGGYLVTEVVAIVGYIDSDDCHGWCMVRAGSPWATRGLVVMAGDATDGDYAEHADDD